MVEEMLLVAVCYACKNTVAACPDCVNTIDIDPETGLPTDVAADGSRIEAPLDPEVMRRSRREVVCDRCVTLVNRQGKRPAQMTCAERHAMHEARQHVPHSKR